MIDYLNNPTTDDEHVVVVQKGAALNSLENT